MWKHREPHSVLCENKNNRETKRGDESVFIILEYAQ